MLEPTCCVILVCVHVCYENDLNDINKNFCNSGDREFNAKSVSMMTLISTVIFLCLRGMLCGVYM